MHTFLFLFAFLLSACTIQVPPAEVVIIDGPVTETVTVTNTVTMEAPVPDGPSLVVNYTTALSGYGDWPFSVGDAEANFGGLQFAASEPMQVFGIQLSTYVNTVPYLNWPYTVGENNGVNFADHFQNCWLKSPTTEEVVAGPADPTLDGTLNFQDFPVNTDFAPIYNVICDHVGPKPLGVEDGFAIDFANAVAITDVGEPVIATAGLLNGGSDPNTARILTRECNQFEIELADGSVATAVNQPTITLSAASPSGSQVPGELELLRFNISAGDSCVDVEVEELLFQINATDNLGSGWIGSMTAAEALIKDLSSGAVVAGPVTNWDIGSVQFYDSFTVEAGSTLTLSLYVDTSGASATMDDSVRADIAGVSWNDGATSFIDGVDTLPVTGNTLTF